jgi:hypothetical protein
MTHRCWSVRCPNEMDKSNGVGLCRQCYKSMRDMDFRQAVRRLSRLAYFAPRRKNVYSLKHD